jgi:hypothetical protein
VEGKINRGVGFERQASNSVRRSACSGLRESGNVDGGQERVRGP